MSTFLDTLPQHLRSDVINYSNSITIMEKNYDLLTEDHKNLIVTLEELNGKILREPYYARKAILNKLAKHAITEIPEKYSRIIASTDTLLMKNYLQDLMKKDRMGTFNMILRLRNDTYFLSSLLYTASNSGNIEYLRNIIEILKRDESIINEEFIIEAFEEAHDLNTFIVLIESGLLKGIMLDLVGAILVGKWDIVDYLLEKRMGYLNNVDELLGELEAEGDHDAAAKVRERFT